MKSFLVALFAAVIAFSACGSSVRLVREVSANDLLADPVNRLHMYGAQLRASYALSGESWALSLEVNAPRQEVLDFYSKQLPLLGWKRDEKSDDLLVNSLWLGWCKEDRGLSLNIEPSRLDSAKTSVLVVLHGGKRFDDCPRK